MNIQNRKGIGISAIMLMISGLMFAALFIPATTVGSLGSVLSDAYNDATDLTDTTIEISERRNMSDLARFVYDRAKAEGCADGKGVDAAVADGGYPGLNDSYLTRTPDCFGAQASTARQAAEGGVIGVANRYEEGKDMEGIFSREEFRVTEDVKIGPNQGNLWMDDRIIAASSQTRSEQIMDPCTHSSLMQIFEEWFGKTVDIIQNVPGMGTVQEAASHVYSQAPGPVKSAIDGGYSAVGGAVDVVDTVGEGSAEVAGDLYDAYYDFWLDEDDGLISGAIDGVTDAVEKLPGGSAVVQAVENGVDSVTGLVVDVTDWYVNKYNDALDVATQFIAGKDFTELFTDLVNRHVGTGDHYVIFFNNHDTDGDRVNNWIDESEGFQDRIYCEFFDTQRSSFGENTEGLVQSLLAEEQADRGEQYLQLCEGDEGYIQMNRNHPFNAGEAGRSLTGGSREFPFIVLTNTGECS